MSTQIRQYFNSNQHQFIWTQFCFLDITILQEYFMGNNHYPISHYHQQLWKKILPHYDSSSASYVLILFSGQFNVVKSALESPNSMLLSIFFLATGDIICGLFWFCFSGTLECLIEGEVGINGGLENFSKLNKRGWGGGVGKFLKI